jgi:hypothetical protein
MAKLVAIIVTTLVTAGIMVWGLSVTLEAPSSHHGDAPAMTEGKSASH